MYTVYKTVNLVNGKYYIGVHKTDNVDDEYLGSGKLIKRAIKKYGKDSFIKEIIAIFPDKQSAYELEEHLVIISDTTYNLKKGGEGGFDYLNDSSQMHIDRCTKAGLLAAISTQQKIKDRINLDDDYRTEWYERQKRLAEHARTFSPNVSFAGKSHSKETKIKMAIKAKERTGPKNSQYGKIWVTNGNENKMVLPEQIPYGFYKGRSS